MITKFLYVAGFGSEYTCAVELLDNTPTDKNLQKLTSTIYLKKETLVEDKDRIVQQKITDTKILKQHLESLQKGLGAKVLCCSQFIITPQRLQKELIDRSPQRVLEKVMPYTQSSPQEAKQAIVFEELNTWYIGWINSDVLSERFGTDYTEKREDINPFAPIPEDPNLKKYKVEDFKSFIGLKHGDKDEAILSIYGKPTERKADAAEPLWENLIYKNSDDLEILHITIDEHKKIIQIELLELMVTENIIESLDFLKSKNVVDEKTNFIGKPISEIMKQMGIYSEDDFDMYVYEDNENQIEVVFNCESDDAYRCSVIEVNWWH